MGDFTQPGPVPAPDSRGRRWLRGFWGWLRQWYYWDGRPTPAQYREVCDRLRDAQLRIVELECELVVAQAEAEAAVGESEKLAAVVLRDRERVMAEQALAVAERETNLNTAGVTRGARVQSE